MYNPQVVSRNQAHAKQVFVIPKANNSNYIMSYKIFAVFEKRLSRKSDNVVVFPFAFHIAVQ